MREAWISPYDNSVRVTMDRGVFVEPDPNGRLATDMEHSTLLFKNWVILELKFTNRFPDWFRDLVRGFDTMQCGAAKYAEGILTLGEEMVNRAFAFDVPRQINSILPSSRRRPLRSKCAAAGERQLGQMIDTFFRGDFGAAPTNFPAMLLGLLLAFAGGHAIAWVYMLTHSGLSYSRAFVNSLIVIRHSSRW
jgi:hypothetical protein